MNIILQVVVVGVGPNAKRSDLEAMVRLQDDLFILDGYDKLADKTFGSKIANHMCKAAGKFVYLLYFSRGIVVFILLDRSVFLKL